MHPMKTSNLVLRLEDQMVRQLDTESRHLGLSKSQLVRKSIEDFLWRIRFDRANQTTLRKARAAGFFSEEDIFQNIS